MQPVAGVVRRQVRYALAFVAAATVVTVVIRAVDRASLWPYPFSILTPSNPAFIRQPPIGSHDDSWYPMMVAVQYLHAPHTKTVYDALFFGGTKFQYPLTSLLPLEVLRLLGVRDETTVAWVCNVVSWLGFLAIGALLPWIWAAAARRFGRAELVPPRGRTVVIASVVGLVAAHFFYPLARGLWLGQIQTLIVLLVGLGLLAFLHKRLGWAGVLFALCCLIKPQWAFILVWAAARRQWRFVVPGLITGAVGAVVALALYGLRDFFGYVGVARALSSRGESYYANQTANGLINRMLSNGPNLEWDRYDIAPANTTVAVVTLVVTVLLLAAALLWRVRQTPTFVDLSIVILTMTIASPVAWEHHYGVVAPILAAILPVVAFTWERDRERDRATVIVLGIAAFLISQDLFVFVNRLADTPWNFLQSYLFFAGLALLGALFRLSTIASEPPSTPAHRAGGERAGRPDLLALRRRVGQIVPRHLLPTGRADGPA